LELNRRSPGFPCTVWGCTCGARAFDHWTTVTWPFFPASGLPAAQVSPFEYTVLPGGRIELCVNSIPGYAETNLLSVALVPDWLVVVGLIVMTPWPLVKKPAFVAVAALEGGGACWIPQMSKTKPAYHVVPTVGGVVDEFDPPFRYS